MAKECASASSCDRSSCEGCPSKEKTSLLEPMNVHSSIKRVIGVISGKGGVGKSLVTASYANILQAAGYKVGILDADITGPSIGRMYGITDSAMGNGEEILPLETKNGLELMSVNFLLPSEDTPVIWRGPILGGTVKQFWSEVRWGELDYLLVDMPTGTGDVPLTVFQSLPVDGVIIVSSPQDLVAMIVRKAYNMVRMMNIPVVGLVENYSYLRCPDCGKEIPVFGESKVDAIAKELGVPVLGKLPVEPAYARLVDEGRFDEVMNVYLNPEPLVD